MTDMRNELDFFLEDLSNFCKKNKFGLYKSMDLYMIKTQPPVLNVTINFVLSNMDLLMSDIPELEAEDKPDLKLIK